ncbi:MAG TPA: hypothetical protein VG167_15905 [Verrucomicrobiae bacterium]|nr:hypothetical protein [Verrucomicrobiae bacterium]
MQTPTSSISDAVNSSTAARRPRLSFTAEERQAVLERYRSSGLKQQEFIAGEGISKATLGKWLQRERREARAKVQKPRFQEMLVSAPTPMSWQLEIVSPRNWTLRFATTPAAVALEQVLRSLPC